MTYLSAASAKESITHNTGYSARVCIQNGQFEAEAIPPGTESQLSTLQRSALYVVFQGRCGADDGCGMMAAMGSGIFDSREQANRVMANLAAYGWLAPSGMNRYHLTDKGLAFVKRRIELA